MKAMNILKNTVIVLLLAFVGFLSVDNTKAYNKADEKEKKSRDAFASIVKLQSELKYTQARLEITERECKSKLNKE